MMYFYNYGINHEKGNPQFCNNQDFRYVFMTFGHLATFILIFMAWHA